jgi:hypothetical protein
MVLIKNISEINYMITWKSAYKNKIVEIISDAFFTENAGVYIMESKIVNQ